MEFPLQVKITLTEDSVAAIIDLLRAGLATSSKVSNARDESVRSGGKQPDPQTLLIDTREVARLLGLGPRTVWGMANSGRMPRPIKIGRTVRWNYEALRKWVDAGCPNLMQ